MPLLPEQITEARFQRQWWRGYDHEQVAAFLARVAGDYTAAITRIAQEAAQTPEQVADARRQADTEAAALRSQAEQTASTIVEQATRTAQTLTDRAQALHDQAQADCDRARARLEQADARAHELEDAGRQRWDHLRVQTDRQWEKLTAAERRLNAGVGLLERALATLRSRVTLLDQLNEVEHLISTIKAETTPAADHRTTPVSHTASMSADRPPGSSLG